MNMFCRDYQEKWVDCGMPTEKVIFCEGHQVGEQLNAYGFAIKRKGVDH
jgi:hypothetical protein